MVALSKASKRPSMYGGRGIAIAGIVVNSIALCFMVVLGVIMAIALPNLLAARRAANEAYAIRSLRTIAAAEEEFQHGPGSGNFGTINELVGSGLLQPSMTREMRSGYRFQVRVRQAKPGVELSSFEVVATPQRYVYEATGTGKRSFFINEFGVIRAADKHGREADVNDPPLDQNGYRGEYAQPTQAEY
jgi:type IV pilus assembly protein PilA